MDYHSFYSLKDSFTALPETSDDFDWDEFTEDIHPDDLKMLDDAVSVLSKKFNKISVEDFGIIVDTEAFI